jgi:hypothetical protein
MHTYDLYGRVYTLCFQENCHLSLQDLNVVAKLQLPTPGVADCAVREDGRVFALACWDGKVRLAQKEEKGRNYAGSESRSPH